MPKKGWKRGWSWRAHERWAWRILRRWAIRNDTELTINAVPATNLLDLTLKKNGLRMDDQGNLWVL